MFTRKYRGSLYPATSPALQGEGTGVVKSMLCFYLLPPSLTAFAHSCSATLRRHALALLALLGTCVSEEQMLGWLCLL